MDDGWPQSVGCPENPALAELWERALCMMHVTPDPLLDFLRAGGELTGALAAQLGASIRCGDVQLSHGKQRGPSRETSHQKKLRRYEIGAFVYARVVRSPRAMLPRILAAAQDRFGENYGQCEASYKEFKRALKNENPIDSIDAWPALIRASDALEKEAQSKTD